MSIRVAQVKVLPKKGDLSYNAAELFSVLDSVSADCPDVVVTPEAFLDGYVSTEEWVDSNRLLDYAIDLSSSAYMRRVSEWAERNSAWVILGCTRKSPAGPTNSAIIFDRRGRIIGSYDKVHCQNHDRKYVAGDKLPVFDSDFGPFGVLICADRRWPETVRTFALKRARIIFNPAYGSSNELNLCMMRTRSYESEVYIVFTHPRQALVTGPKGNIISNCEDDDIPFTVTEIDLGDVDTARAGTSAHLKDRRPDVYET